MAQSTVDIEAIIRRLNKNYSNHRSGDRNRPGTQNKRRRPGVPQGTRLPSGWKDILDRLEKPGRKGIEITKPKSIRPKPPDAPRGRRAGPGHSNKSSIPETPSVGVNSRGALERRIKSRNNREDASKEKKRSRGGKPQWQPPDSVAPKSKGNLRLVKSPIKFKVDWGEKGDKNYTQTGEDAGWHRARRVKKSQGRPIEQTPKKKKSMEQIAREALLRRRKSA